jgi:hypothetical protein
MLSPGFATTGPVRDILMTRPTATDSGQMLTNDATRLAGYPMHASINGPTGALVFSDWSQQTVLLWNAIEVQVGPHFNFLQGIIGLRVIAYVDFVLRTTTIAARTSVS